ncbi:MAG: glycosyltransferase [Lachnospiraceae bacterium]|nr:glycosyltransferase [Lachnospiraceae bacterium]
MDKISIIIPAYNVSGYLRKCLDSVLNQTYNNLEIILVNDGSTDNSGEICDEYAQKDSRFHVIHQANRGLSAALNVGLNFFTGDYLGFVDSDDWIEPEMFELLLHTVKTQNVPIAITNYYKDFDNKSLAMSNRIEIPPHKINIQSMLLNPLKRDDYMGFCGYVWNKLYTADIIRSSEITFDEDIKYGMDTLFYTELVLKSNATGAYINKPLYHYLQRDTAISKSKSYKIKYDILIVYKKVEELLNSNGYSEHTYWARGFYCYHAGVIAKITLNNDDKEAFKHMQEEIAAHLDDYAKTNIDFPEKVQAMSDLLKVIN